MQPPEEALQYPLTSVQLALANINKDLRQGSKATFRKLLIDESNALCLMPYREVSDWFIDGMAAIMAVKVKETWQEYAHSFLE